MGAYLAENTHRVAYHVTAPRWNLRAPPTTGSERKRRVVFHTKSTQVLADATHGHARGFPVATRQIY